MEKLVLMEALAEVVGVMRDGARFLGVETAGKVAGIPFSELDRADKVGLLESGIDWTLYRDFGMEPEQATRIVENAAAGRPQDQWLEPVQHESPAKPSFDELLKRCATVELPRGEIQRGREI